MDNMMRHPQFLLHAAKNIGHIRNDRGFTIVELLIVIVIIAVLAAITIVAYNGITARAKSSSALSAAKATQKKAEAYIIDGATSKYPLLTTNLTDVSNSGKTFYLTGVTLQTTAPTSTDAPSVIMMRKCAATNITTQTLIDSTNISGLRLYYFDYVAGNANSYIPVGNDAYCPAAA